MKLYLYSIVDVVPACNQRFKTFNINLTQDILLHKITLIMRQKYFSFIHAERFMTTCIEKVRITKVVKS